MNPPELFNSELMPLFSKLNSREVGSCLQSLQSDGDSAAKYSLPRAYTLEVLDDRHSLYLQTIYVKIHSHSTSTSIPQSNSVYKNTYLLLLMESAFLLLEKSSIPRVALAYWDIAGFGPFPTPLYNTWECNSIFCPVKIHHFALISFSFEDEVVSHILIAVCSWYLPHSKVAKCGKPVQLWCAKKFEHPDCYCFIPINQHHTFSSIG